MPVALGLGCFLAWKEALVAFLYPISNGLIFSPLVCQALAGCLVLAVALAGVMRNRAGFPLRFLLWSATVMVVLATVAAVAITAGLMSGIVFYGGAIVIGATSASLLYAWAEVLSGLTVRGRIGTATASVLVCALLSIVVGQFATTAMNAVVVLLGIATLAGFVAVAKRAADLAESPLIILPGSSNHFRLLLLALVLYAFVFGVSAGTTAERADESTMHSFVLGASWAMAGVTAVMVVALVLWRRTVRLSTVGRFLTPILALLFLLHILLGGSANGWLPRLTMGFWQLVQMFVLLVLIDVAHSGLASLSFAFPLGWAIVSLGYAGGALFGQAVGVAFGVEAEAVNAVTVSLTIVAVMASSILGAAQYPRVEEGSVWGPQPVAGDDSSEPQEDAGISVPAPDPIVEACAQIVARYGLSEREQNVLDLLARGNTRASIAEKLCISENTVRVHVKNIYSKLHIHSKQQLIDMVDKLAA